MPSEPLPLLAHEVSYSRRGETRTAELVQLLEQTGSSAFLVLVDGTVVTEWYGAGYARDVPVTSFSLAKSVTGLLVLAALEDGYVSSLDDPVTAYLPELRAVDPGYDAITLRHLLDMRSGVRFRDHDLPWGDKARVYYEPHLRELVMSLPVLEPAGAGFAYNSYNPVLLGLVLERATGVEPALYLERRVWETIGAENPATWSTSREGETLPKMESGLNATPIDFVKLGLALIGSGAADAPADALADHLRLHALPVDPANPADQRYGLGWWVYPGAEVRPFAVAGSGHLGQYLFVYPDYDVVIARFGERLGAIDSWRPVFDAVMRHASR